MHAYEEGGKVTVLVDYVTQMRIDYAHWYVRIVSARGAVCLFVCCSSDLCNKTQLHE